MDFKGYITSILYISCFGIILELFLPKTKLKKYISSIVSLLIIITIISPVFNVIKEDKLESVIDEAIYALSPGNVTESNNKFEFKEYTDKVIMSRVKENLEKELYDSFAKELSNIAEISNVEVRLNDAYYIEEVVVYINEGDVNVVKLLIDRIVSKYEIPSNMLRIIKKGVGNGEIY